MVNTRLEELPAPNPVPGSSLPEDVEITFRRMDFEFDDSVPRDWFAGDPAMTHFFIALSLLFPEGEKFFIDSVRNFEDADLDPRTRHEVREFIKQEAHHSFQHRRLNNLAAANGVNVDGYEKLLRGVLNLARRFLSKKVQLAITVALEHFTAVLANELLTNPEFTDDMDPAVRPLWMWHAVEETEHKAVAFDVYQQVGGTYWVRVIVMGRILIGFPLVIAFFQGSMLVRDPRPGTLRMLRDSLRFVYGRDGLVHGVWPELKAYFRRDFHPWQVDNRELIAAWEAEYDDLVTNRAVD